MHASHHDHHDSLRLHDVCDSEVGMGPYQPPLTTSLHGAPYAGGGTTWSRLDKISTIVMRMKSTPSCLLFYLLVMVLNVIVMIWELSGG